MIVEKIKCTGCGACVNICPKDCIKLEQDKEGFLYPKIDEEKCINCGLCRKICPSINYKEQAKTKERFKEPVVMAAFTNQNLIRLDSTSGGIFTELAKVFLNENEYVCGAIYDENWLVKHIVTNKLEDLEKLRSSKYLQSRTEFTFQEIKEKLNEGKKVFVCGTPCQISGLYAYLGNDYDNLITCDFICRGVNSPKIFLGYIENLQKKWNSKIKNIKFKNKTKGWHNFSTKIDFENGKTYIGSRYTDSYMVGYLNYNCFIRPCCYECQYKELPRVADITLADFWGIELISPEMDNDTGTSLVLLNSKKGYELFNKIKSFITYKESSIKDAMKGNACLFNSVEKKENRDKVFENIDKYSYEKLSKCFFPKPTGIKFIKLKLRLYIIELKKRVKVVLKK